MMDKPTFEEIVRGHGSNARRWLRSLGVRSGDLDDVMQEVLSAIHRGLPAFDSTRVAKPASAVRAWLFEICKRQAANARRRRRRRAEKLRNTFKLDGFLHPSRGTEDRFEDSEQLAFLGDVLEEIDPTRRAILIAHAVHGIPMDEVARAQGILVNTAWNCLRLARDDLKAACKRRYAERMWQWRMTL